MGEVDFPMFLWGLAVKVFVVDDDDAESCFVGGKAFLFVDDDAVEVGGEVEGVLNGEDEAAIFHTYLVLGAFQD